MHELSHNFGLTHSGNPYDAITQKPNHLSVMNYLFQLSGLPVKSPIHVLTICLYPCLYSMRPRWMNVKVS